MSQQSESQDIEAATTAIEESPLADQPDSKTRRYDRQLRLWAASGQAALESSRVLVIGSSATSTSILKNLVLPGIGHYTILDSGKATLADIGNNFFLEESSLGKSRAEECVRLLGELNDSVNGVARMDDIEHILTHEPDYLLSFNIIITHNLNPNLVNKISASLENTIAAPSFFIIRSAGFLAELFIQFQEHAIIESHAETTPSLRIDKPFPALLQHAKNLNFSTMDPTEHGHIPYVVILVRAMHDWKAAHGGDPPKNAEERKEFKAIISKMAVKADEENFEEAEAQAYRAWTETTVPYEVRELIDQSTPILDDLPCMQVNPNAQFYRLLWALREFLKTEPYTLPLTSTLPDMKSDTQNYIHLQRLYKTRAEEERDKFKEILYQSPNAAPGESVEDAMADEFVKNAHAIRILKGEAWGVFDKDPQRLESSIAENVKGTSLHLALSALDMIRSSLPLGTDPTQGAHVAALRAEVQRITTKSADELPEEIEAMIGEIERSPTADLPTTAAFLGGLAAQEVIKVITKQYIPITGYLVVDLISSETFILRS